MGWMLLCASSVGVMLGFGFAAMLAAGMRADLEERLVCALTKAESARLKLDAMTECFGTLCRVMAAANKEVGE